MTIAVYEGIFAGTYYICIGELDPELKFCESLSLADIETTKMVLAHRNEFRPCPRWQGTYLCEL